jgi:hypothetical protein
MGACAPVVGMELDTNSHRPFPTVLVSTRAPGQKFDANGVWIPYFPPPPPAVWQTGQTDSSPFRWLTTTTSRNMNRTLFTPWRLPGCDNPVPRFHQSVPDAAPGTTTLHYPSFCIFPRAQQPHLVAPRTPCQCSC